MTTRKTPELDRIFSKQPTLEQCPECQGVEIVGERCDVCGGAGMVTVAVADRWRVARGERPKRGPLPPPRHPKKKAKPPS